MTLPMQIQPEVSAALEAGEPVVALETTVIAQGLPHPVNLETAREAEAAVRAAGAQPATIGILEGQVRVGLDKVALERFAGAEETPKLSTRDLGPVLAAGGSGATTVAATLALAELAGIQVFATGGIGGVHRGGEETLDISADLAALARHRLAVVSAGAKAILDLPRTLELLESLGVPVIGLDCERFPAFYLRDSGLPLPATLPDAAAVARAMAAHWALGLDGGLLVAHPPPAVAALDAGQVERWIAQAEREAWQQSVAGKALTPFLLERLAELSGGRTLETNAALIVDNARAAAEIAVAYAALPGKGET